MPGGLAQGAGWPRGYDGAVAPRSRSFTGRIRDQLLFSVVAVVVLFIALRLLGVRSTVPSLFLSVLLTLALNVGLSYWGEARARSARRRSATRPTRGTTRHTGGGDIRWRDEDR